MRPSLLLLFGGVLTFLLSPLEAQEGYQQPPAEVLEVMRAPRPPATFVSPTGDALLFARRPNYLPVSLLAEPMLKLAGTRFNPNNRAERSRPLYFESLSVVPIPQGGTPTPIEVPANARLGIPSFSSDGQRFVIPVETSDAILLYLGRVDAKRLELIPGVKLNPVLPSAVVWMPDQSSLLLKLVPPDQGPPPKAPDVPPGPKVFSSAGTVVPSSTYESRDLLKTPHDAALFAYYATSQLALLHLETQKITLLGAPGAYSSASPSPDGLHLLVERLEQPYSFLRAWYRFPSRVEVWKVNGELEETLAVLPAFEQVPIDGVQTGPRDFFWGTTSKATLFYAEALDEGNPKNKVPFRDKVLMRPFPEAAVELVRTEHRFTYLEPIEESTLLLIHEYDRDRHWERTTLMDSDRRAEASRVLWDMSSDEKYAHPGYPETCRLKNGQRAICRAGDFIYLNGMGASPDGDRPFLDRLNLVTFASERLFRSSRVGFEDVAKVLDPLKGTFLATRESPTSPPNFYLATLGAKLKKAEPGEAVYKSSLKALTQFPDPTPQLRGITKQLITYTRADGVPLSFTLYLPPGYQKGTRLPTVFWAYPLDYAQSGVAGQLEGSDQRFTFLPGTSELYFLLRGYAVLDDVAMPVVGPPDTAYDTFIEQIVANAEAAINKAVEMGVTDPSRVGVGGHSHGALMTANLLAWSDLFRAGIARSGAYNHTLRPFGFQNEKRTFFEARETYLKLSPTLQADRINEPLLLIHGEVDQNPGTVPLQSEKLFEALRGVGATSRLVILPYEGHGYQAQESAEHVIYEMLTFFDTYVKNAPQRAQ